MKTSITLIISGLFVLVSGAYFYLMPAGGGPQNGRPDPVAMQLLTLEKGDRIAKIKIEKKDQPAIVLSREGEDWKIEEPVSYPADQMLADGLSVAMIVSVKERKLPREKGKSWKEYGLEDSAIKVGVKTAMNDTWRVLFFGDSAAIGNFVYARWEGENEYFLVNADLKKAFDRTVYSLRFKQFFRTPLADVRKIRIKTLDGDYELTKQDDKWYWMDPVSLLGEAASKEQVDDLLMLLRELGIKDFLDKETRSVSLFGISNISPQITLWGAKTNVESIKVGLEVPTKDAFYGQREGDPLLLLVARANIKGVFAIIKAMADESMKRFQAASAEPAETQNAAA